MIKAILTLLFKLSYLTKSVFAFFLSLLDDLLKFFDDVYFYIFNSLRSIRYEEVREFISDNFVTIVLLFILLALIYSNYVNKKKI